MPQDAAASGAQSDADSSAKGESEQPAPADAGSTGAMSQGEIDKIVGAKLAQKLSKYGDLNELQRKAAAFESLEESQKTESQKLNEKIATLEREASDKDRQLRDRLTRYEIVRHASRLGFADPEDAYRMIDSDALTFADDGVPTNTEAKLAELLEAKPYLRAAHARVLGSADGGIRSAPPAENMNALIRRAAGRA